MNTCSMCSLECKQKSIYSSLQSPQPLPLWSGNRIATRQVDHCWQFDPQFEVPVSGSEDCLYLNIYRPMKASSKSLNVVVFLHGGGFHSGTSGSSFYGPEFFMETGDVILVVPAYRLNVFGFLSTGDKTLPGNYGLKDQTMALKWVRDNVAAFGGDPGKVTLMGHEAGAVSVNYHLISRSSEGLFHKAAMLSGMANMPWTKPLQHPRDFVNAHAIALGLGSPEEMSNSQIFESFRSLPAQNLTQAMLEMKIWDNFPVTSYLPDVELEWLSDPFLTNDPEEAMKSGNFINVPVLSTIVPGDGIRFVQPLIRGDSLFQDLNENMNVLLPLLLRLDSKNPQMSQIVDEIRFHYFSPSGFVTPEGFHSVLKMSSDYYFQWQFHKNMQRLAGSSNAPVFGHMFNYRGLNSFSSVFLDTSDDFGVVHGDDQMYMFRIGDAFPVQLGPTDIVAKNFHMNYIMDFIKTGNPGYDRWRILSPEMATTINFNESITHIGLTMIPAESMEFWDRIDALYQQQEETH